MSKKQPPKPGNPQPLAPSSNGTGGGDGVVVHSIALDGLYENWFMDYASYVILERAVPAIEDGLKPVQRRILHAMRKWMMAATTK